MPWPGAWRLAVAFSSLAVVTSAPAQNEPPVGLVRVIAPGQSSGTDLSARDAAVAAATEAALRIWLASNIGDTDIETFAPMLRRAEAYAESTRITKLTQDDRSTQVELEVYYQEWPLRVDAAALVMSRIQRPPRVLFLLGEQLNAGAAVRFDPDGIALNELQRGFGPRGFEVIDPAEVRKAYTQRQLLEHLSGGVKSAAWLGRSVRADIVVAGRVEASVRVENRAGAMLRARATVDMQVIRASDARLFESAVAAAEVSCRVAADGVRAATVDAAFKVRDAALVAAALAAPGAAQIDVVEFTLENPQSGVEVEQLGQWLRGLDRVDEVEVFRAAPGEGYIRFRYSGRMGSLVKALEARSDGTRRLEPIRVVGEEMVFRFVRR